ncbi:MAG: PD40 domain-containing protein [Sphingosinicella sp.]|nr:PD40 domain-containing protein [Sphingosinicella sp.]
MAMMLAAELAVLGGCAQGLGITTPYPVFQVTVLQQLPISSPAFESHAVFDEAGKAVYFVRSSPAFQGWRLQVSECGDGGWTEPRSPSFAAEGLEADPFLSDGGTSIYFISNRTHAGKAGADLDIYVAKRENADARWGPPERLPKPVNSAGAEWFPRPAPDGWLYFGSDRPGGFGGTDIYRAREQDGVWKVENLGSAVNSAGDEFEAEISPDGSRMVMMADGDIFVLSRAVSGWSGRIKLGQEVNTPALEVGPTFSPSGRAILFARDFGAADLPIGGSGEFVLATTDKVEAWPPACP